MLKKLSSIYQKEQLNPSLLGLFVNPFYFAKNELKKAVRKFAARFGGRILDAGCGQKPYRSFFKCDEYIGLELDTPENRKSKKADYYYDGRVFPFKSESFDGMISNEVLEHVFNPEEFLAESNRVLKRGGYFLVTAPFVWDEHEQPYDYARYSSFGLKFLLEKHGFEVIGSVKTLNDIRIFFQLIFAYMYKKIYTRHGVVNAFLTLVMVSPLALMGEVLNLLFPRNDDLYLDNVVLARKIK